MMSNNAASPYNNPSPYSPASSISTVYSPADASISQAESYISTNTAMTTTHQPRQRLRPWLSDKINSGKVPGLKWMDKDKMIFKISWKHFGRPGVDEYNDAMLFRLWALHTKKYHEGQPPDISTWKTRFRCALHKLPDIDELNNLNQTEGDDPYRVYQFKRKGTEVEIDNTSSVGSPLNLPKNVNPVVLSPAPSNYSDYGGSLRDDLGSTSNHILTGQLSDDVDPAQLMGDDLDLPNIDELEDMDLVNTIMHSDPQMSRFSSSGEPVLQQAPTMNSSPAMSPPMQNSMNQNSTTSLLITLFYADQEVGQKVVDNPRGLRIAFNPPPPLPDDVVKEDTSEVVSHIFGPFQAEQIYFPPAGDERTTQILECIKRGLVLQARNGEILATRLCRAKVFYSDSVSPTDNVKELPREHTTVIFDYFNDFLPKLRLYMLGQGPRPICERYFSFGQKWSQSAPLKSNFIYVSVTHCLAKKQLIMTKQDVPILISDPNMLDIIAKQIEDLSVTGPK